MTEVLCTGTFNILHPGHCELLEFAARFSRNNKVTVGINADWYLKKKYGEHAIPLASRAYVLECNKFVEKVVVFTQADPSQLILQLSPSYYVRGPDYDGVNLPEQDALDQTGCKLIIHKAGKKYNASELIESVPKTAFDKLNRFKI